MIPNFRAWYSNEMWLVAKFDLWGDPYQTTCDLAPLLPNTNELYDVPLTDVALMQSTGLKDKNGVEIYEGDICSTDLSRPYLVVVFRNGAFMYQCHDEGRDYFDIMLPTEVESDVDRYTEVIGNIYENSELLMK